MAYSAHLESVVGRRQAPLRGGLAPGATVMSWRGTEVGIKDMEMGRDVIMASDLFFKSFDTICNTQERYIRYHAYRSPMRGFLFLDEVIVN